MTFVFLFYWGLTSPAFGSTDLEFCRAFFEQLNAESLEYDAAPPYHLGSKVVSLSKETPSHAHIKLSPPNFDAKKIHSELRQLLGEMEKAQNPGLSNSDIGTRQFILNVRPPFKDRDMGREWIDPGISILGTAGVRLRSPDKHEKFLKVADPILEVGKQIVISVKKKYPQARKLKPRFLIIISGENTSFFGENEGWHKHYTNEQKIRLVANIQFLESGAGMQVREGRPSNPLELTLFNGATEHKVDTSNPDQRKRLTLVVFFEE